MGSAQPFLSVRELAPKIERGELSSASLVESTLERIDSLNPFINAYITIFRKSALKESEHADKMIRENNYLGPLHGIPIAFKDNIQIRGVPCTAGSKILKDNVAENDATIILRLKRAGAILIGTTNMHEFGSGVTNINPYFGSTHNPWDRTRLTGGSSGGSAAAVAAGLASLAIGTDTSGSTRIPASLCGTFGFKPSYGFVSKYGVVPLSPSLDHVGFLARSSWDIDALIRATAGRDPLDDTTRETSTADFLEGFEDSANSIRIGVPRNYFLDTLDSSVSAVFSKFLERLSSIGFSISDVEIENIEKSYGAWAPIRLGEAATFHRRWFVTRSNDYGPDVRRMIEKGLSYDTSDYRDAFALRDAIKQSLAQVFRRVDLLVTPTVPVPAPKLEESQIEVGGKMFDIYSLLTRLTIPFNVAGLPALSIPVGLTSNKLPVGAQFTSALHNDRLILIASYRYEKSFGSIGPPPELSRMETNSNTI